MECLQLILGWTTGRPTDDKALVIRGCWLGNNMKMNMIDNLMGNPSVVLLKGS